MAMVVFRQGTKTKVVELKNTTFKSDDKISVLEEALGKNVKLKEAYGIKNKKTFALESDKTFKECFDASKNTDLVINALNKKETSIVMFITEQ